MKRIFSLPLILALSAIFPSCLKDPVASFTADRTSIDAGETIQFTDLSANEPDKWLWSFDGGTPSTSQEQNPVVTYMIEGIYSVTLEVRNRKSSDVITMDNYITVLSPATDVTFINNTYTNILLNLDGVERTLPINDSITYFDLEGTSVEVFGIAYQVTAQGDQIGMELYWDFFVPLEGGSSRQELNVGIDYFFLLIENSGTRTIGPIEVYQGDAEPVTSDVSLPADGVKYGLGYYKAYMYAQVRAYYQDEPGAYTYWNHYEHFFFPYELNQFIDLRNTYKKGTPSISDDPVFKKQVRSLLPAFEEVPVRITREGVTRRFPVRSSEQPQRKRSE